MAVILPFDFKPQTNCFEIAINLPAGDDHSSCNPWFTFEREEIIGGKVLDTSLKAYLRLLNVVYFGYVAVALKTTGLND